ncbi:MAG: hypothetical protein RLZZ188_3279 [Verrucomicrobiota bacterium]
MNPLRAPAAAVLLAACATLLRAAGPVVPVGLARVDITPETPILLSGYQSRAAAAERIEMRLHARALAIGEDGPGLTVLVSAEVIAIGEETADYVAAELKRRFGLERARLAVTATHTHAGPALADTIPFMFSRDLPAGEQERIDRHTRVFRERLIAVAADAIAARRPARLDWGEGRVDVAAHRRTVVDGKWKNFGIVPGGPVDHALPVLRVTDPAGTVRGVLLGYACHCTTLGGNDNFVHPDWAGDAAARIEATHGGAPAIVTIGCGADANPSMPRGLEGVPVHGAKVAAEVARVLGGPLRPLGPVTAATLRRIELPLDRAVTRAELEIRTKPGARTQAAYAARRFLADLDAGRPLPKAIPYVLQAWSFGRDLRMVFLAGEVVSEYSLRLRRELPSEPLWFTAYANATPCYIPSRRMYPEGGYEVDASMDYYGWPTRLDEGTEDLIIGTVRTMLTSTSHSP